MPKKTVDFSLINYQVLSKDFNSELLFHRNDTLGALYSAHIFNYFFGKS